MSIIRTALGFPSTGSPLDNGTGSQSYGDGLYAGMDYPPAGVKIPRGEVSISGHVFHLDGHDCEVKILIDDELVDRARWGLPRYDVYQHCMLEAAYQSGFVLRGRLARFPARQHTLQAIVNCRGRDIALDPLRFSSGEAKPGDSYLPRLVMPAGSPGVYKRGGEEFLGLLSDLAGLLPAHSVLEIGCGMGRGAVALAGYLDATAKYYGLDVLREAVEFCTRNISRRYPNFIFRHIDVENGMYNPGGRNRAGSFRLPLSSASIDLVFLWSVFTHMRPPDIAAYLQEISRILKPGATLVASCFLMTSERLEKNRGSIDLKFDQRVEDFWTTRADQPEQSIAIAEASMRQMYVDSGLSIKNVIFAGGSGVVGSQDVIIATR